MSEAYIPSKGDWIEWRSMRGNELHTVDVKEVKTLGDGRIWLTGEVISSPGSGMVLTWVAPTGSHVAVKTREERVAEILMGPKEFDFAALELRVADGLQAYCDDDVKLTRKLWVELGRGR